jgi:dCTP deaminase
MLLSDTNIRMLCLAVKPLIVPFVETYPPGAVSYGLTSAGYDVRLSTSVWFFKNTCGEVVDPKRFNDLSYRDALFDIRSVDYGQSIVIPARSYVLAQTVETIDVPRWLKGRCVGKSTYARCGIIVNTTPLEPGWYGTLTLEISNANPCPVRLYTGEGVAQLEFERIEGSVAVSYDDRGGKYMGQTDVTPPRML